MKRTLQQKAYCAQNGKAKRALLIVLIVLVLLPVAAVSIVIATFDINTYRPKISEAASDALGRKVTLDGPIDLRFSLSDGFVVAVKDVTLANPAWASRPLMAKIGEVKLHVGVMDLIQKKLNIVAFDLDNADVLLENNGNDEANWNFKTAAPAAKPAQPEPQKAAASGGAAPISIKVQEASILDSHFGMKNKGEKATTFDVPELKFTESGKESKLNFRGKVGEVPVEIHLTGGKITDISGSNWPFKLEASYEPYKIEATGTISDNIKKIALDPLNLTAKDSSLNGFLNINLAGARPMIVGKLHAKELNPKDFAASGTEGSPAPAAAPPAGEAKGEKGTIFTRDPIPLDGLKAADANIDVVIDKLVAGPTPLEVVHLPIDLKNGRLSVSPFSFMIGGNKGEGHLNLDAATPSAARIAFDFNSKDVDLAQLASLWNMESVIAGKTDVDMSVTTAGNSTHDFAANANGSLNLLMETGTVSSSRLKEVAGALMQVFAPGVGSLTNPGVNCAVARYTIQNGVVVTKGMLIDTQMTTIQGDGTINLPDERVNMSLHTQPKALGVSTMVPPMKIYGPLSGPSYTLDAAGVATKVVGLLTNGVAPSDGVPKVVPVQGKNACAAALDNPAPAAESTLPKGALLPSSGTISDTVKDIGNKLKGLGGGLFGN